MKKTLSILVLLMASLTLFAQNDVTRFLGIPVDGSKSAMIRKLKEKGFTPLSYDSDVLEGEFNGSRVHVRIVTNNNKVWRIALADAHPTDETNIKIRFNELCRQFKNNSKYMTLPGIDYMIPDDENIRYEMSVHNKRYQTAFNQRSSSPTDTVTSNILVILNECYQGPSSAIDTTKLVNKLETFLSEIITKEELEELANLPEDEQIRIIKKRILDMIRIKTVWFMIEEYYGKYRILMYYDNEYNRAKGEDL